MLDVSVLADFGEMRAAALCSYAILLAFIEINCFVMLCKVMQPNSRAILIKIWYNKLYTKDGGCTMKHT